MPRRQISKHASSEEEDESVSENSASEEEQVVKRQKGKDTKKEKEKVVTSSRKSKKEPSESAESESEEDEEDDMAPDEAIKQAQAIFDEAYERYGRRASGQKSSAMPANTNLYLKVKFELTRRALWMLVVHGKNNYASDKAMAKAKEFLDDMSFKTSYRVELPPKK